MSEATHPPVRPLLSAGSGDKQKPWFLIGAVAAMFVFTMLVNLSLSRLSGHLAMVPTYDDVNYFADALVRLRFADGFGLRSVIWSIISDPPHAPVTTLTGMLGFWLFGPEPIAAYIANGWVMLLFLVFMARMSRPLGNEPDRALFIGVFLFVTAVQAMVMEFRPDLPSGLMLAIAVHVICRFDFRTASLRDKIGLAAIAVATTIIKPSAVVLTIPVLSIALGLGVLTQCLNDRKNYALILKAALPAIVAYFVMMVPFALIWGQQTIIYIIGVLFTYADVWRTPGDAAFHWNYHLFGVGGQAALGHFVKFGIAVIAIDLMLFAGVRRYRQRGVIQYYIMLVIIYCAMATSGEKTPYQGSLIYLPIVIGVGTALVRVLAFAKDISGVNWLPRAALIMMIVVAAYRAPLAFYYYGAAPNSPQLPPIVERIVQRLVEVKLANVENPQCTDRPLEVVSADAEPIPVPLIQYEAAKAGVHVVTPVTFMMRDLPDMETIADHGDIVLIADPSHHSTSRWLPGVVNNTALFDHLTAQQGGARFDVGSPDGTPQWLIVAPRCVVPK
ncbi:hypothetical protein LB518_18220 [Mesorhizobium sp. BR1-1-16]|uniref:hypothetical protein n=1 Tax=Mesorhizobium sp. BR1-1-16 TaxID=2876653 RepID=UPI001CCA52BC|nr:hypothetical protein [Mesorhizobium sp. BR1-1-16]MBZ9938241.1 hypothetical protein [Mesorhizobium sp. BR1-1-16]